MRRRLEAVLPVAVLVGFLAAAIVVKLLLSSAQERAVDALEESAVTEVSAIATTQNQRVAGQIGSASGFIRDMDLELVPGSTKDRAELQELFDLLESALPDGLQSGFFITDASGTITDGFLLQNLAIGDRYSWPDLEERSQGFPVGYSAILSLGEGVTTDQPVIPNVVPIRPAGAVLGSPTEVRGLFVFEQVVSVDSDFNKEVGALRRGETGTYVFVDSMDAVLASNDPTLIGRQLEDPALIDAAPGLHREGGRVVIAAEVPAAQWRVLFHQDADEFEESLAGPLETAGTILIFVLLLAGFLLTLLLYRRLRSARAEKERLEQLSASQQEFISIVSHELRTPVAGVLGFLETSLDHWDSMDEAARRSAVSRAAANARRLQAMTRDVLDTQSLETGQLVHVLDRVDLVREVADAVDAVRGLDAERELVVDVPDVPVWVSADADRLQQVLANLIDNARKHSPVVEPVEVAVTSEDGRAHITVRDRGAGISDESLERIFDKFVRGRGESVTGTGLGLYISRQIVEAHGGRIWAESADGGATFHVILPLDTSGGGARIVDDPEVVNT